MGVSALTVVRRPLGFVKLAFVHGSAGLGTTLLIRNHQVEPRDVLRREFLYAWAFIGQPVAKGLSPLAPCIRKTELSRDDPGAINSVGNRPHLALIIGKAANNLLQHRVNGRITFVIRKDREREARLWLTASLNDPKKGLRESGDALWKRIAEEPSATILKERVRGSLREPGETLPDGELGVLRQLPLKPEEPMRDCLVARLGIRAFAPIVRQPCTEEIPHLLRKVGGKVLQDSFSMGVNAAKEAQIFDQQLGRSRAQSSVKRVGGLEEPSMLHPADLLPAIQEAERLLNVVIGIRDCVGAISFHGDDEALNDGSRVDHLDRSREETRGDAWMRALRVAKVSSDAGKITRAL